MHLVGNAANIWQLYLQDNLASWTGLVELLMRQFGSTNKMDHQAALARLSQTGSVTAYRDKFTKLSCRATGFSPELRLACFVGGLKEEIRVDVRAMKPTTLLDAYELAKLYEERAIGHRQQVRQAPSRSTPGFNNHNSSPRPFGTTGSNVSQSHHPARLGQGERHMSQSEYHDRRARKQCFFCDEPYTSGHRCTRRENAKALVIDGFTPQAEEIGDLLDMSLQEGEENVDNSLTEALETPLITLNVLTDDQQPNTMQIQGVVGNNRKVHILIDSGSTHNFVHPSLMDK